MEEKKLTGYPSIDKPWLKYYSEEAINAPLPECSMYEYMRSSNMEHDSEPALEFFGRLITYGELFVDIDRTAQAFATLGVKEGDIVSLCTVTTPETIYALYALNKLGAISNMVDPRTSADELVRYIQESNTRVLMTIDAALPKIVSLLEKTDISKVIVVSPSYSMPLIFKLVYRLTKLTSDRKYKDKRLILWPDFIDTANSNCESPATCPLANRPAAIVHTGGTTGTPKGVVLSNNNLNSAAYQGYHCGLDYKRRDIWLDYMPPFIAYGIGNGLHLPLSAGMKVILLPNFNPAKFDRILLRYKPNHMAGVPSHWETVIYSKRLYGKDLSFIRAPVVGGDSMNITVEQELNTFFKAHQVNSQIIKGYGMTETCAAVCVCAYPEVNKPGSVGIPFPKMAIAILDPDTHEELTYGQMGEIAVFGPNCMLGYYKNQAATEVLMTELNGERWMLTGDLGYMDEDGCLFVIDRVKRIIIRPDGFKIFPSAIENTIIRHKAVASCAVVGIQNAEYIHGMAPHAFVVLHDRYRANAEAVCQELVALCKKELAEYAQPLSFRFLDALPLTPIGKVDYRALEQMAAENT